MGEAAGFGEIVLVAVPLLALFVAGDDEEAKRRVAALIDELGFAAVDTGSLAAGGRRQQPDAPVYNVPMRAGEAEAALA